MLRRMLETQSLLPRVPLMPVANVAAVMMAQSTGLMGGGTAAGPWSRFQLPLPSHVKAGRILSFWEDTNHYSAKRFRNHYRLSRAQFRAVFELLKPELVKRCGKSEAKGGGAKGHDTPPVSPEVQMACGIRFMAGAAYQDLAKSFYISDAMVYVCFWNFVEAVNATRDFDMSLMPALEAHAEGDSKLLDAICAGFTIKSGGLINGCIGAPDGCHLEIRKPPLLKSQESVVAAIVAATERRKITKVRPGGRMPGQGVVNPRFYFNYKGFMSVNLQAVADAQRRFIYGSVTSPGSEGDQKAWACTSLGDWLESNPLPPGYYFLADEAYKADEHCVTPYPGQDLPPDKDNFNHLQCTVRSSAIECAFGRLVGIFGIFWRPWRGTTGKFGKVVLAAMKMSNVLIDYPDDEFEDAAFADLEDSEQQRRTPQGWRRSDGRDRPPSGQRRRRDHAERDHSAIRDALKEEARKASYFRPGSSRA